ncbi:MAG: translation initiation factor IF-2 subunit alpha [Candidatus Hydrothermarchaeales archaeon]
MVFKRQKMPGENDLVICTISKVFSHGAFARLDEYEDREGFIHISEVASTWIKNIRDFVKKGQKTVVKVLSVDLQKGHIDLSLRRVGETQKKTRMQEWKRAQKADKLLELAAKEMGKEVKEAYREVGFKLENKYGEVYAGFEEISISGEEILKELEIPPEWFKPIITLAQENVTIPSVDITGYLDLKCSLPNGVDIIKEALLKARKDAEDRKETDDIKLDVVYTKSPRFSVTVFAPDYKVAEEALKEYADKAIEIITTHGGTGQFVREKTK